MKAIVISDAIRRDAELLRLVEAATRRLEELTNANMAPELAAVFRTDWDLGQGAQSERLLVLRLSDDTDSSVTGVLQKRELEKLGDFEWRALTLLGDLLQKRNRILLSRLQEA